MEYRINRKTGDKISVLGMGTSAIAMAEEKEAAKTLEKAFEEGINYYDMATSHGSCFQVFGKVMRDVREKIFYQIHFGADYTKGAYGWTTDLETVKRSVDWQLEALKTDYIDYGFLHCLDEEADWKQHKEGGILQYLLRLREQGVVRHLGLSSHTPATAELVLDTGLPDMLMLSINPAYDYECGDEWGKGNVSERMRLYQRCETEGVGISVMKAFSGGQLLDAKTSPFGRALTAYQCIQYILDKPGVLTVLPGVRDHADLEYLLGFFRAEAKEKDYALISSFAPKSAEGKCVYCDHCQPCPEGLAIALINKYYDLALAGDVLAGEHYKSLEKKADDCIGCGHCSQRCPFHVDQLGRMREISGYFGR